MSSGPTIRSEPREVHRVGRRPDPWRWAPWKYAPFTGRWDDPDGRFRVLYTSASRFACLVEVLAPFRPDPAVIAASQVVRDDPRDATFETVPVGVLPAEWLDARVVGTATLEGAHIAVGEPASLAWLRRRAAALLVVHGLSDIDGSTIRETARAFTRALSRWLYELESPLLDGIEFESRHGNGLVLWATYESVADGDSSALVIGRRTTDLSSTDPDLRQALELHGLRLDGS